jgi:hypothetical protein
MTSLSEPRERVESPRGAVAALAAHAQQAAWQVEALPWEEAGEWEETEVPEGASLLASTPLLQGMSPAQAAGVRRLEMASHLAALSRGEQLAVGLAASTVLLCPPEAAEQRWFLGTLLADEAKHHLVLERYLAERMGGGPPPPPVLDVLFAELTREGDFALNLLAAQVVLEGAAASLLNALLVGVRQPLLRELLRHIGRDEARHMKFAHLVAGGPEALEGLSEARRRRMEEVLFEAAHAACASLMAAGAWGRMGLEPQAARQASVDALRARGVLDFFTRTVVRQLGLRGFPGESLGRTLSRHLEDRLRERA